MTEELVKSGHRDPQHVGQLGRTEIGAQMRAILLYVYLDECHQLSVVLQVGITLPFHASLHDLSGRLCATAQVYIPFQPFRQVEVATYHAHQFVLQAFYLAFQKSNLILEFFNILCHLYLHLSIFNDKQLQESTEIKDLLHILRQILQNSLVAVTACMFEDVEDDTQTTTGDVIQFRTIDHHIAVCTFKYWCETAFCLAAGSIIKVSDEGRYEPSCLFVNRDVQHVFI